jgi:opacity protein-like surface antigen
MKSTSARGACLAIMLASLTSTAWCQDVGLPGLLPLPPLPMAAGGYPVSPAAATTDALWGQHEPAPVPQVGPSQGPVQTVLGPDYAEAMKGGYEGCTATAGPCGGSVGCHNHYVYANALVMNRLRPGGFVTSVDGTGSEAINFCNREFGRTWVGGFEVGTGWCFGCNCNNALEVVYWGLYPSDESARASGNISSLIDFGSLDYNGADANTAFTNAGIHVVESAYSFNSVEVNLVGNCLCGGPFGCGMCGCCMGRAGSPWGFGYTAGFRYINFSDRFLFSSDPTDGAINGDPQELNYLGQFNNNLFGFQLGSGLSYCVTDSVTAYVIGKVGIYDNHVTGLQRVYGTLGNAVINNGPYDGEDAIARTAGRETLAISGQFDLGGRWAINDSWSVNFGYRVLGISGVATTEANFQQAQFHDLDGMAFLERSGSLLLHGAFAGATYCW